MGEKALNAWMGHRQGFTMMASWDPDALRRNVVDMMEAAGVIKRVKLD